jgi:hypothetical protein
MHGIALTAVMQNFNPHSTIPGRNYVHPVMLIFNYRIGFIHAIVQTIDCSNYVDLSDLQYLQIMTYVN